MPPAILVQPPRIPPRRPSPPPASPSAAPFVVLLSVWPRHRTGPVALYAQQTHHLLCPCHQSQFDIKHEAKVIFGPAKRPLPQLPITVDDEGYLNARSDFTEPVGASFWERNT